MRTTTFDQNKWNLKTFNKIGYDPDEKRLYIFYFNGSVVEFSSIEEEVVFKFILSLDKECYVEETLSQAFPSRIKYKEASLNR